MPPGIYISTLPVQRNDLRSFVLRLTSVPYKPPKTVGRYTCSGHRYSEHFRRALKPSQDKEEMLWCRREWERTQGATEIAKHRQERLTKCREKDRAGRSTLTAAGWICINLRFSVVRVFSLQSKNLHNLEIALCILRILRLRSTCAISRSHVPVHSTASDLLCSSQDGRHPW